MLKLGAVLEDKNASIADRRAAAAEALEHERAHLETLRRELAEAEMLGDRRLAERIQSEILGAERDVGHRERQIAAADARIEAEKEAARNAKREAIRAEEKKLLKRWEKVATRMEDGASEIRSAWADHQACWEQQNALSARLAAIGEAAVPRMPIDLSPSFLRRCGQLRKTLAELEALRQYRRNPPPTLARQPIRNSNAGSTRYGGRFTGPGQSDRP